MMVEVRRTDDGVALDLTGEWRALAYPQIDLALAAVDVAGARRIEIATDRLAALDLTGAWRLREFVRHARRLGAEVAFAGTPPDQLRLVEETLAPLEGEGVAPVGEGAVQRGEGGVPLGEGAVPLAFHGGGAPGPRIRARALAGIEDTLSVLDEGTPLAHVHSGA